MSHVAEGFKGVAFRCGCGGTTAFCSGSQRARPRQAVRALRTKHMSDAMYLEQKQDWLQGLFLTTELQDGCASRYAM